MEKSVEVLVLLFAALATGGLVVNWIGLGRAMSRLQASAYVEFHQYTNHTFDPYMPIVAIGAPLGGIALTLIYGFRSLPGQLAAGGAVCYAMVLIIGVPTCVRINQQIEHWSIQQPPVDWAKTRERWIRFHIIRTLFSIPAFVLLVLATTAGIN